MTSLLNDKIWIIGILGCIDEHQYDKTLIYCLDIHDYSMMSITTDNHIGGIYNHSIALKDDYLCLVEVFFMAISGILKT